MAEEWWAKFVVGVISGTVRSFQFLLLAAITYNRQLNGFLCVAAILVALAQQENVWHFCVPS